MRCALNIALLIVVAMGAPIAAQDSCVGFAERVVVDEGTNGVERVLVADVDGDGDLDLFTSSFGDGKLFWYENDAGGVLSPGEYDDRFTPHLINENMGSASGIFSIDLDNDADLDLIAASRDGFISWFEQAKGNGPVFTPRFVTGETELALGVYAADVNADGWVDVLSASFLDNTIAWYQSSGSVPLTFTRHVITDLAIGAAAVWAGQVDGDPEGRIDVLAASRVDGEVALYRQIETADGAAATFEKILIAGGVSRCSVTTGTVCVADADCPFADPEMTVHEDCLPVTAQGATSVDAADLDGDGDVDVVVAALEENKIVWYENDGEPTPSFAEKVVTTDALLVRSVRIADVDGDGKRDLIAASYGDDTVAWYPNDGDPMVTPVVPPEYRVAVRNTNVTNADDVGAGDLDGDGRVDLVSVSSVPGFPAMQDRIAWYPDSGDLSESYRISRSADGAVRAVVADVDGDGDLDAATVGRTNRVSWFRNDAIENGMPLPGGELLSFEELLPHVSDTAAQPFDIVAADLGGDMDIDFATLSQADQTLRWFESDGVDPVPGFTERTLATGLKNAQTVIAADMDGDGDLDLVSAERGQMPAPVVQLPYGRIQWYEWDAGAFTGSAHVITDDAPGVRAIHVADVDGDGDADLLAAIFDDNVFAWYESVLDSMPGVAKDMIFNSERKVIDSGLAGPSAIYGADIDGDMDLDVAAGAAGAETIHWYRNDGDDGMGGLSWFRQLIVGDADDVSQVFVEDLDGDGDSDIVAAVPGDSLIAWFENGDANADPIPFTTHIVVAGTDLAFATSAGDINLDGKLDLITGERLNILWFAQTGELCVGFDADGDDMINGVELAWIGRSFGMSPADPGFAWAAPVDYTGDGVIDGEDLAVLASNGVFGFSTTDCRFTCN